MGALVLVVLPPVGSAVALGQDGAEEARHPAKLEVSRNTIDRGDRRLNVLAPITKRASGKVGVELHAAGERYRFDTDVNSDKGYIRFDKRIPRAQARLGTGIVTITYPGNARTRGQEVRLRAAPRRASLDAQRPEIQAEGGQLRLRSQGELSQRARGVVRVQLDWVDASGANRSYEPNAKIDDGKWRLDEALPAEVAQSIDGRRSTVHSYTLFTGYLRARMRGEMEAYQVLPAPPPAVVAPLVGPIPVPAQASPPPPPPPPPAQEPGEGTVQPDRETTLSSGGFSLTVPPGVVEEPASASVRPVGEDGDDLTGPAALFHIDASWEDGTKRVRLTMPIDPALQALGADYAPAVVHYLDNGQKELFGGEALTVDKAAGTVTFETTSLSKFRSWSLPRAWFYFTNPNPISQGSLAKDLFGRFVGTRLVSPPSCNPDVTNDSRVSTSGSAFEPDELFGNAPAIRHCVASRDAANGEPERGRWVLANNTGAVLTYAATGGASVVNVDSSGDALTDLFFAAHNDTVIDGPDQPYSSQIEVPPGAAVAVTVPAGSSGDVDFGGNAALLIPTFVVGQLGDLAEAAGVSTGPTDLYQALDDCGYSFAQSERSLEQLVNTLRCAKTANGIANTKLAKVLEKPLLLATAAQTVSDQLTRTIDPVNAALAYAAASDPGSGSTERVSVSSEGNSYSGALSADGRFVAFDSRASDLVAGDTNASPDVFVHDRSTGVTERVSVSSTGAQGTEGRFPHSVVPALSADGRYVAFHSGASNLVADDTNGSYDVFVHDRSTGATQRVSVSSTGAQADPGLNSDSRDAALSADGRYVAFVSGASNLVADDTNDSPDVFVHDRSTGATERVSVSSTGAQVGYSTSYDVALSADGRFVSFTSTASNLVAGDTNDSPDVFVHDHSTGTTQRVSVSSTGAQAEPGPNSFSQDSALSADGRFVSFVSTAWNLVAGDTNGSDDVFVHDRSTGTTQRVSVSSTGAQAGPGPNSHSQDSALSADGRFVSFVSGASNLVAGDTNAYEDVFVHDRSTGVTQRVSVSSTGAQASNNSYRPALSANGRFVAFDTDASNLVPGDTNGTSDVFVRDRGAP